MLVLARNCGGGGRSVQRADSKGMRAKYRVEDNILRIFLHEEQNTVCWNSDSQTPKIEASCEEETEWIILASIRCLFVCFFGVLSDENCLSDPNPARVPSSPCRVLPARPARSISVRPI